MVLVVDHVTPVALGGTDLPDNLVTACSDCNSGKTSTPVDAPLVSNVAEDAMRWSKALIAVALIQRAEWQHIDRITAIFDQDWTEWTSGPGKQPVPRPDGWEDSVRRWAELGLDNEDLNHYIQIAMSNKRIPSHGTWSYFCGCCWHGVEDRQAAARVYLTEAN